MPGRLSRKACIITGSGGSVGRARRSRSPARVLLEFDVHYTRHDGEVVTLPCCNVFRLRDGFIAKYRSYIDATPVYAQA